MVLKVCEDSQAVVVDRLLHQSFSTTPQGSLPGQTSYHSIVLRKFDTCLIQRYSRGLVTSAAASKEQWHLGGSVRSLIGR